MIRATLRRKATTWAVLLGCGFALVSCELEKVAGSSVTTGNPTEIQVGFTGESGPVAIAGRVEIYGATQIPIAGFRPEPLKRYDVDGNSFTLTHSHFEGIADSLWPAGSMDGDTLVRFNLVISSDASGSILRGMSYRPKSMDFILAAGLEKARESKIYKVDAGMAGLTTFSASIKPEEMRMARRHFLFVSGTSHAAEADSTGKFVFENMPGGRHPVSFLSIPKEPSTAGEDSVNVFTMDQPIEPGNSDPLSIGSKLLRIPLPEEYKK